MSEAVVFDFSKQMEAKLRGGSTELLFFQALQSPDWKLPCWWCSVRRASWQEDGDGVDAFVTTDVGEVQIQIKSSFTGLLKHLAQYGHKHCVVIVRDDMSPEQIRSTVVDSVYRWRGFKKGVFGLHGDQLRLVKRRAQRGHRRKAHL